MNKHIKHSKLDKTDTHSKNGKACIIKPNEYYMST